jgi:hypothetical protein
MAHLLIATTMRRLQNSPNPKKKLSGVNPIRPHTTVLSPPRSNSTDLWKPLCKQQKEKQAIKQAPQEKERKDRSFARSLAGARGTLILP